MGTQIYMKTMELLKAGHAVEFTSFEYEDGLIIELRAKVILTDGQSFYMNAMGFNSLWSDYNDWGSNKAVIQPKVVKHNLPHIIS